MFELPILEIKSFTHLGVSKVETLERCPLKVVLDTNKPKEIFPPNPNAILGSVMHKVFEMATVIHTLEEFEVEWTKELERLILKYRGTIFEKELENFSWQCKHYYPKKNIVKNYVLNANGRKTLTNNANNNFRYEAEKLLISKRMKGKVDVYIEIGDTLIIKDYKTGDIFENKDIDGFTVKSSYVKQVKLYAGIVLKKKYFNNLKLYIISSNGKEYQINAAINECLELLETTTEKVEEVSEYIKKSDIRPLALINKDCKFCNFRYYCPHFEELLKTGLNKSHFDLVGQLKSIIKVKGGTELFVDDNKIHFASKNNRYKFDDLKSMEGKSIIVFNVFQSKYQTTDYFASANTVLFLKPTSELIQFEC